ncbi:hypothetical protein [Streptomyces sp. NPDC093589]|uniref:hypothetical protein n=1 Tax=Streptomyces sp. NPDC093589 TaxID=3366043 RepID=UPI0038065706
MATPRSHAEPPTATPRTDRPAPAPRTDPHTTALGHALAAAERGYAVLPLTRAKLLAVRSPHRGHPEAPPCRGACGRITSSASTWTSRTAPTH